MGAWLESHGVSFQVLPGARHEERHWRYRMAAGNNVPENVLVRLRHADPSWVVSCLLSLQTQNGRSCPTERCVQ